MNRKSWTVLQSEQIFAAKPFIAITREHVITDSGKHVEDYYQIVLPDFAMMCALTPDERVLTLWQYKHGPRAYGLTFPAGLIETGELPEEATRRELLEETGYRAGSVRFLGSAAANGNQGCGTAHMFVMRDCVKVTEADSGDLETTELKLMTVDQVEAAIADRSVVVLPHLALWCCARAAKFGKK